MVIFAGIHEITKELDDMAIYNFKNEKWSHIFKAFVEKPKDTHMELNVTEKQTGKNISPNRLGGVGSPLKA